MKRLAIIGRLAKRSYYGSLIWAGAGKKIIVYDLDGETGDVIERWLNGEGKHIENASWERFNKMKNAVAYRGNSGYTYAIYEL